MLGNLRLWAGAVAGAVGAVLLVTASGNPGTAQKASPPTPAAPLLKSGETVVGERLVYPAQAPAEVTAAVVTLAPGQETGWHTHGVPAFGYVLEGELEVDYGDKGVRRFRAGDALLEAMGTPHNGRNTGSGPMRILAVFMGGQGLATSAPASPPAR